MKKSWSVPYCSFGTGATIGAGTNASVQYINSNGFTTKPFNMVDATYGGITSGLTMGLTIIPHLSELIDGVPRTIDNDVAQIRIHFVVFALDEVNVNRSLLKAGRHHPQLPRDPFPVQFDAYLRVSVIQIAEVELDFRRVLERLLVG